MSRLGWMYADSSITGAVANGPTNSVQVNSGSQVLTGTSNFTFDPATSRATLLGVLTGSTLIISASVVSASTYLGIPAGGAGVPGGTNQTVQFNSGSTFSGSTNLTFNYTNSTLSGVVAQFTTITGSTIVATLITGSTLVISASVVSASTYLGVPTTVPGGATTQIQYNNGSIFAGSPNLTWNNAANILSLTGSQVVSGSLTITGSTGQISATTLIINSNATVVGNILGSAALKAGYRTFSGNFGVASDSYFSGISTTGSVVTASFNAVSTYPPGQTMIFKDTGGTAGTNNILLKPSGSQTIDGATGLVISVNSGSVTIVSDGVSNFLIVGTN